MTLLARWRPSVDAASRNGSTAADQSGNSRSLTLNNFSPNNGWVAPAGLYCIESDGSNDYGSASGTPFQLTNAFTIALWISLKDRTTASKYVLSKLNGAGSDNDFGILYGYFTATSYELYASGYTGTNPRTGSAIASPTFQDWHHLAYTYDGTTLKGYLNGTQSITVTTTFSFATSTGALNVMAFKSGTSHLAARFDDVLIASHAYTSTEIAALSVTRHVVSSGGFPLSRIVN